MLKNRIKTFVTERGRDATSSFLNGLTNGFDAEHTQNKIFGQLN